MKRHTVLTSISVLLLSTTLNVSAAQIVKADYAKEHTTHLDSHVHGLSELTIVMEGTLLEMTLTSPAMDLIGFEHKASSQQDIALVENAGLLLSQSEVLFLFSGGRCVLINTSIDLASFIQGDNDEHVHHEPFNEYEHHNDHDNHVNSNSHSDIAANYQYRCKNKASLSSITVNLFEFFPGIHKIRTMWVKQTQQGSATLTKNNRTIEFR